MVLLHEMAFKTCMHACVLELVRCNCCCQASSSMYMNMQWRTQDLKKGGVAVEGDHQKGEGAGGGCAPSRAKRGSF